MKNVIAFAHKTINEHITKDSIVVDATIGNGHDTVFLAKHAKHVFGFDIQNKAIEETRKRCDEEGFHNVTLLLASHEDIDQYVKGKIDAVMYNLGYLPNSDKKITTKADITIHSIEKALTLLNPKGRITITVYIGHQEGKEESQALEKFLSSLDSKLYTVIRYQLLNKDDAPYTICIEKR